MIKLTCQDILLYANEAIEEKGEDYVYGLYPCHYVMANKPSCLVGNIMHRAGISLEVLEENEGGAYGLLSVLKTRKLIEIDANAEMFLIVAQRAQDNRVSWGNAVKVAEAAAYHMNLLSE